MDQDLARLGAALKATRLSRKPKLTQDSVAAALGISRGTVQNIERGTGFVKVTPTIRAFAQLVGWKPGSIERVLAGGEPVPGEHGDEVEQPSPAESSRLPLRIQDEIEGDRPLVDTRVIPLGDGTNMVVIVTGKENPTREERQRNLERWERAQEHLEELSYPSRTDQSGSKPA